MTTPDDALRAGVALIDKMKARNSDDPTQWSDDFKTIIAALEACKPLIAGGGDPVLQKLIDRVKRLTQLFTDEPTEERLHSLKEAKLRLAECVVAASPSAPVVEGVMVPLGAVLQIVKDKRRQQSGFLASAEKGSGLWGAYNIGVGVCADIEIKIAALSAIAAATGQDLNYTEATDEDAEPEKLPSQDSRSALEYP